MQKMQEFEHAKGLAHTPIIVVTANAMTDDRHRFTEVGMDDYISKPYTESDLVGVFKKFLKGEKK